MKKTVLTIITLAALATNAHADCRGVNHPFCKGYVASKPTGETARSAVRGIANLFGYKTNGQVREAEKTERAIKTIIAQNAQCGVSVDCYTVTGR